MAVAMRADTGQRAVLRARVLAHGAELRERGERLWAAPSSGEAADRRRSDVMASRVRLLRVLAALPRRERRTRRLARQWLALAEARFSYRMDSHIQAEEQAWRLMRQLPERACTRRDLWDLRDARAEARHVLTRSTASCSPRRSTRRVSPFSPLADQVELLRRIDDELAAIWMGSLLGGGWRYRRAVETLEPWLREIQDTLAAPLPVAELEEITAQWRTRRARLFDDHDPADVIIVERLDR
jgi:hypothetical protein